jgi:serine/threonine protein kinase
MTCAHALLCACVRVCVRRAQVIHLFMEYFPLSLSSVIKHQREQTKKPLSPAAVRTYALEVAKGMHYMHSLAPPILHRYPKNYCCCWHMCLTEIADSVLPPPQRHQEQQRVGCLG